MLPWLNNRGPMEPFVRYVDQIDPNRSPLADYDELGEVTEIRERL